MTWIFWSDGVATDWDEETGKGRFGRKKQELHLGAPVESELPIES